MEGYSLVSETEEDAGVRLKFGWSFGCRRNRILECHGEKRMELYPSYAYHIRNWGIAFTSVKRYRVNGFVVDTKSFVSKEDLLEKNG